MSYVPIDKSRSMPPEEPFLIKYSKACLEAIDYL